MSRLSRLSTTSYAVLGLLSLRSWTTYELAQQMGRSLDRIWPRAESKVYEEPKKLVANGYARFPDGRVLVFMAESGEATRVHPMQLWRTPFCSDDHAVAKPPAEAGLLGRISTAVTHLSSGRFVCTITRW